MSNVKIRDKDGAYKTYTDINEVWLLDEKEGQRVFVTPPSQKYFLLSGAAIPQEVLVVGQTTYGPTTDLRTPFKVGVRKLDFGAKFSFVVEFDKSVQTEGLNFVDGAKSFQLVFSEEAVEGKLVTGWNFLQINEGGEILSSSAIEAPGNILISVPQPFVINSTATLYNFLIPDGLEDKEITIVENGTQEILPTEGKLGIRKATIKTEVPLLAPNLQEKKIVLGADAPGIVSCDEGYDGLSKVSFDINGAVIAPENIAEGTSILGVPGEHKGGAGSGYNVVDLAKKQVAGEIHSNVVTEIGPYAFSYHSGINNAVFPNTQKVDEGAFAGCTNLTEAYLPSAEIIGDKAFQGCTNLRKITMVEGQSSTDVNKIIGHYAFDGCENLEEVPFQGVRGDCVYRNCKKIKTAYLAIEEEEPGGWDFTSTMFLPSKAMFQGCESLTTIKWLKGTEEKTNGTIKGLPPHVFDGCSSLTAIPNIQNLLTNNFIQVGEYCCRNCSSLKEVEVSGSTSWENVGSSFSIINSYNDRYDIGHSAFRNCSSLQKVTIYVECRGTSSDKFPYRLNIGEDAFSGCTSLKEIYIKISSSGNSYFLQTQLYTGAFNDTPSDMKIYVPYKLYSTFTSSWPNMANQIYTDPTEGSATKE